jgi:breast cancer 2 susceptibility protein
MAPWHAKLGFKRGPCIVVLDKLTADGGSVPALDVIVVKVSKGTYRGAR